VTLGKRYRDLVLDGSLFWIFAPYQTYITCVIGLCAGESMVGRIFRNIFILVPKISFDVRPTTPSRVHRLDCKNVVDFRLSLCWEIYLSIDTVYSIGLVVLVFIVGIYSTIHQLVPSFPSISRGITICEESLTKRAYDESTETG